MEQIVLNVNLKYVITSLNIEQRGHLLNALLCVNDDWLKDDMVADIYTYIKTLQDEIKGKKQRMKQLSMLGVAKRKMASIKDGYACSGDGGVDEGEGLMLDLFGKPSVDREDVLRKEAKEYNNININKNILSSENVKKSKKGKACSLKFVPPKVEEVRRYVDELKLELDAEEFVDFYESRGWCVGNSKIKNWQAMAKLWHRRAMANIGTSVANLHDDDEYWHQLLNKVEANMVIDDKQ